MWATPAASEALSRRSYPEKSKVPFTFSVRCQRKSPRSMETPASVIFFKSEARLASPEAPALVES